MKIQPKSEQSKTLDFDYHLPSEKIAYNPLPERDSSKLLVFKNGTISDAHFIELHNLIPTGSMLIFNNTKVIAARIHFKKASGGKLEIFLLEPTNGLLPAISLQDKGSSSWNCIVGGVKKWKNNESIATEVEIEGKRIVVYASIIAKKGEYYEIQFTWSGNYCFSEIIECAGNIPLPPYIKRETSPEDKERYQTVYAKHEGSVAAPTAGLHFTTNIMQKLQMKGISTDTIVLHVGAGTFKPVTADNIYEHVMHEEIFEVSKSLIEHLIENHSMIIAVGTTSLRTLESIYWLGVKYLSGNLQEKSGIHLQQWENLNLDSTSIDKKTALSALLKLMKEKNTDRLAGTTGICITPGYYFKMVNALITNFHQPQSTLLFIIAAITGNDWKKIYKHALENEYRFLSYGDSSLLFIQQ